MNNVRILLADADSPLVASYRQALGDEGYEVETAGDGLACVDKLRLFRPHVLVLEPALPWGGGDGVLARMLEEDDLPIVPVILLTDRPSKGADRFPFHACHAKPLAAGKLAGSIRDLTRSAALASV